MPLWERGAIAAAAGVEDESRFAIPNERPASDTIGSSAIRSRGKPAVVTVRVPLASDLRLWIHEPLRLQGALA